MSDASPPRFGKLRTTGQGQAAKCFENGCGSGRSRAKAPPSTTTNSKGLPSVKSVTGGTSQKNASKPESRTAAVKQRRKPSSPCHSLITSSQLSRKPADSMALTVRGSRHSL